MDVDIKSAHIPRLVEIIAEEEMLDAAYLLVGSVAEGLLARGVDIIQTDRLEALVPLLRGLDPGAAGTP